MTREETIEKIVEYLQNLKDRGMEWMLEDPDTLSVESEDEMLTTFDEVIDTVEELI